MHEKQRRTAAELRTGTPPRYSYPDKADQITHASIVRTEPYPGYWEQSEEATLSDFSANCARTKRKALLDVGAGEGRLARKFSCSFEVITALEPDPERIAQAKAAAARESLCNIRFVQDEFLTFEAPTESFDVILISHVIQHIETSAVPRFFTKAHNLLRAGGKLVVTTCHRETGNTVRFAKSIMKEDSIVEVAIDQNEFNRLIVNDHGILPVRFFSFFEMRHMLGVPFHIDKQHVFHALHRKNIFDLFIFRDSLINIPCARNFFGRDMYLEATKR